MKQTTLLFLLMTAIFIPLACIDYHHLPYSDGAEHGAAVRELSLGLLNPGEPMLNEYVGKSPRYVPSIVLMAAAVRLSGMDMLHVIKIFSVLFFIFFLYSVAFFAREYFHDTAQAVWSIGCMLFLWGTGWHGSNAYMFSALVHTAWYPSLVSFSCIFMALACACRFLRKSGPASLAGWCLFGAAAFVNHPLTASFFWVASVLLILETKGLRGLFRPCLWTVIGVALAAMALWPYYDFFANMLTVSSGSMAKSWDYRLTRTYLYSDIAARMGPALVAVPILFINIIKKKHGMLTNLCLVSLCIYACGYFLHISLAERFIFAVAFSSQLLIANCAYMLWQKARRGSASTLQTTCAAVFAIMLTLGFTGQMKIVFQEYIRPNFITCPSPPYIRYQDPTSTYKNLANYIHPGDIVFSDSGTAWAIPLYTGAKIISLFHTPPHVHDNDVRLRCVDRFYDPASDNLTRLHILKDCKATKLLVNFPVAGNAIKDQINRMGLPLIVQIGELYLYDAAVGPQEDLPTDTNRE